jgi:hypothetical protein
MAVAQVSLVVAKPAFTVDHDYPFVVEAAGVEPASENVTGQETTCLFTFLPWAFPQDVRDPRSERTRNRCR